MRTRQELIQIVHDEIEGLNQAIEILKALPEYPGIEWQQTGSSQSSILIFVIRQDSKDLDSFIGWFVRRGWTFDGWDEPNDDGEIITGLSNPKTGYRIGLHLPQPIVDPVTIYA